MTATSPTTALARTQIVRGAARAIFASEYANQADEAGKTIRGEVMDQLPALIDQAALDAAENLVIRLVDMFDFQEPGLTLSQKLAAIYMKAVNVRVEGQGDRDLSPENFGHYLAMQALGHGVGLDSFGDAVYQAIPVPSLPFDGLEKEYF